MRIYGGKDYYDGALAYGRDPSITLVRYADKRIPYSELPPNLGLPDTSISLYGHNTYRLTPETITIVFCHKTYKGVTLGGLKPEFFWAADKLRAHLATIGEDVTAEGVHGRWWRNRNIALEEFFAPQEASPRLFDFMVEKKISILQRVHESYRRSHSNSDAPYCLVNPYNLKGLGFAKAVDPFTAFQELSMWIGGVLGGTSPEMVTIKDDKVLAESHGFDKESFRGPRIR